MTLPNQIIFDKYADSGFVWQGAVAVESLPRLADYVPQGATATPLNLSVTLNKDKDNIVWLAFDVDGALPVACHRCLEPMMESLAGEYRIAIITHDGQLPYVENDEYVFLAECLVDERYLPIVALIEDELILGLPLSFSHDDCQMAYDEPEPIIDEPKENPFAILSALKGVKN